MGYWESIASGFSTAWEGLRTTLAHTVGARHRKEVQEVREEGYFGEQGMVTLRYPDEQITVPPLGRYKLDCEIDDCIVCDKCARVCPVDCIAIEAVKSPTEWGQASDGSGKRLYASKFEIDMAKCCYCGLCTTVCPTECLVMTPEYDYSTNRIEDFVFQFANLTPEQADQKRAEYDAFQAEKAAAAAAKKAAAESVSPSPAPTGEGGEAPPVRKAFKPVIKKKPETTDAPASESSVSMPGSVEPMSQVPAGDAVALPAKDVGNEEAAPVKKPFRPVIKVPVKKVEGADASGVEEVKKEVIAPAASVGSPVEAAAPKKLAKIVIKPPVKKEGSSEEMKAEGTGAASDEVKPVEAPRKPAKIVIKAPVRKKPEDEGGAEGDTTV